MGRHLKSCLGFPVALLTGGDTGEDGGEGGAAQTVLQQSRQHRVAVRDEVLPAGQTLNHRHQREQRTEAKLVKYCLELC